MLAVSPRSVACAARYAHDGRVAEDGDMVECTVLECGFVPLQMRPSTFDGRPEGRRIGIECIHDRQSLRHGRQ